MSFDTIINKLKEGNARFVADELQHANIDQLRRDGLTSGQSPDVIVLSCADSRVVPELAFDAGLGELFVVRVAGNIANSSSLASIEYAVAHVGSKVIIVLGHESCGAVTAALAGGDNGYNLNHLLAHIVPAIQESGEGANLNDVVRINARKNAEELVNRSAIVRDAVNEGRVRIVPAYYNLTNGKIDFLD